MACGCFVNMTMDTDQKTLWHSVLEGIGYDYMGVTDIYRKGGVDLNQITITEGGSRSRLWNQIKSDMINTKVKTLKSSGGAVLTNILTAAYAVGDIPDLKEKLSSLLETKDIYTPDLKNADYYRKIYTLRKKMISEEMREAFSTLKEIR